MRGNERASVECSCDNWRVGERESRSVGTSVLTWPPPLSGDNDPLQIVNDSLIFCQPSQCRNLKVFTIHAGTMVASQCIQES